MKKYILIVVMVFVVANLQAQEKATTIFDSLGIVQQGAQLTLVSKQFAFTEGPVADKKGNIYFTDQPNNTIWRYNLDGTLTLFTQDAGCANGLSMDKQGHIIACADANNELWSISLNGKHKILLGKVNGQLLNGPNDVWVDAKGGIYFTDPYYQRDYWTRRQRPVKENVYYLPKGAPQPILVSDALKKPNGIVGTRNGKNLFVADIEDNKTYKFSIDKNGRLKNKTLFVAKGADGITLDAKGNLYLAGNGVTVFNTAGQLIAHIPVPESWTANLCFGGKQHNLLFITAIKAVYVLKMNVKGE